MRYIKRANIYRANNLMFNPETCQGYSYDWWRAVDKVDGKVLLNTYAYSNTTIKHIYKLRSLLRELDINIDHEIEAPKGLQNLDAAIKHYQGKIKDLEEAIARPRTHESKNEERREDIKAYAGKIAVCRQLQYKRGE